MGLIPSIRSTTVLALDTNVFIYALKEKSQFNQVANVLLEQIRERRPKVFISVLVLEEIFIRIFRENSEEKIPYYLGLLTAGGIISIVDVSRQVAIKAAQIRANYRSLRTPDAIHLATAIESKAKFFVTADRRLPKKIEKLQIITV